MSFGISYKEGVLGAMLFDNNIRVKQLMNWVYVKKKTDREKFEVRLFYESKEKL